MAEQLLTEFIDGLAFNPDEFQVDACRKVEAGRGVLVAAPTGAGKTVVGEFAVHCALAQGVKCFYTTPIKALSNQKFNDLVARHGADRVGLLTGDTSINPDADVVIMTTEVLRNMIYAGSSALGQLRYVVMDEVHYLADRFRGAVWEEVIIGLAPSVQIVSLSATVSNAEEFGEWLDEVRGGVDVVVSETRPVPLYQHVLAGRSLHDLFQGVAPTAQALLPGERAPDRAKVNPDLVSLAKRESRSVRDDARNPRGRSGRGRRDRRSGTGGQPHKRFAERSELRVTRGGMIRTLQRERLLPAICFVFSRTGCDAAVRQVLGSGIMLTGEGERGRVERLLERYRAGLSADDLAALDFDTFAEGLRRGVAAHHAGLLPAFKECVEEAFCAGLVKVVFATETLALGINMPARSVVLEKLTKYNGETHADITPGEYTQLTGRAGRRGIDVEGHAVVVWQPGLDPRAVAGLASTRTYPLRSSFAPTYNMAANLVATVGRERARALLELSFAQFQADRSVVGTTRKVQRARREAERAWAEVTCEVGDFESYARLRRRISDVEAEASRSRKAGGRAESSAALAQLVRGDIIFVPGGKHRGWAVVLDPARAGKEPRIRVLSTEAQMVRLTAQDFPGAVAAQARVRVPKHFDVAERRSRRGVVAALVAASDRLAEPQTGRPARSEEAQADVAALRAEMKAHPCHGCPERELHARHAEQALRAEAEAEDLERRRSSRTESIARRFDTICLVLESLGYLSEGGQDVTEHAKALARIHGDLDLVTAEALRRGIFKDLPAPSLGAVLSCLIFEARRDSHEPRRMPDRASERALTELRGVWREVGLVERDHRMDKHRDLELGLAEAIHLWASGGDLSDVLMVSSMTAGDFVRWVRQVVDFAGQIASAAIDEGVRHEARSLVDRIRRGVVSLAQDE